MKKHISQFVLVAFLGLSIAGIWAFQYVPAGEFAGYFKAQLVGQGAEIEVNPFNKLAQQLEQKEEELAEREVELNRREEFLVQEIQTEQQRRNTIILGIVVVTVIIVLLNFFLDWRREKREESVLRKILRKTDSQT